MGIIEAIVAILLVMWIGGFFLHIAGGFIHILLLVAIIVYLFRFMGKPV